MRGLRQSAGLVLVASLVAAGPASATGLGKLVASADDSGPFPEAIASAYFIERPRQLAIWVTADPPALVKIHRRVSCYRDNRRRTRTIDLEVTPPFVQRPVPMTLRRPEECSLGVDVSYQNFDQAGQITAKLYAKRRPARD